MMLLVKASNGRKGEKCDFWHTFQTEFSTQIGLVVDTLFSGQQLRARKARYKPFPEFALPAKNWFILPFPAILCGFWKRINPTI